MQKKHVFLIILILLIIFLLIYFFISNYNKKQLILENFDVFITNNDYNLDYNIGKFEQICNYKLNNFECVPYIITDLEVIFKEDNNLFSINTFKSQNDILFVNFNKLKEGFSEYKLKGTIQYLDPKVYDYFYSAHPIDLNSEKYTREDLYLNKYSYFESKFKKVVVVDNICDNLEFVFKNSTFFEKLSGQETSLKIINSSDFNFNLDYLYLSFFNLNNQFLYTDFNSLIVPLKDSLDVNLFLNLDVNFDNINDNNNFYLKVYGRYLDNFKCEINYPLNLELLPFDNFCNQVNVYFSDPYNFSSNNRFFIDVTVDNHTNYDLFNSNTNYFIYDYNYIEKIIYLGEKNGDFNYNQIFKFLKNKKTILTYYVKLKSNFSDLNIIYNSNFKIENKLDSRSYDNYLDLYCNVNKDINLILK